MGAEIFHNIAQKVVNDRVTQKGRKGEVSREVVKVFEDILEDLFERYLFWKRLGEVFSRKESEMRRMSMGLEIDFRTLPVAARIARAREENQIRKWTIEGCLFSIIGLDSKYFTQQVEKSGWQPEEMDKRAEEEVRMRIGSRLYELLSGK